MSFRNCEHCFEPISASDDLDSNFCSVACEMASQAHGEDDECPCKHCTGVEPHDEDNDGEPFGSHDLSDDADALASAGFGTDEDYGYFGHDEDGWVEDIDY